ncbi:MAG: hypothetical protein JXA10_10760 [Anaerolineae bacterium]|nr:hypothetical protein [Anaerolineae bacterium]
MSESDQSFQIEILSQGWLGENSEVTQENNEDTVFDLCSHGLIRLVIDGQIILPTEENDSYGISESALAMLRSLDSNHYSDSRAEFILAHCKPKRTWRGWVYPELPEYEPKPTVAERMIFHGCGTLLMSGCSVGVDWTVEHKSNFIQISNVIRYDGNGRAQFTHFPSINISVPKDRYRQQVVSFAQEVKTFFDGNPDRVPVNLWDFEQHEVFWEEFNRLLAKHSITNPNIE